MTGIELVDTTAVLEGKLYSFPDETQPGLQGGHHMKASEVHFF